ncbi:MAG: DUF58 domain-containing protein [Actinomycetota bacterium]|nr:DUF58 domain-containing protein [Actinomycetota bacterium]
MPSRRGWGLAATAAVLAVAGRVSGLAELVTAATAAAALVAGAVAYVRLARVELDVGRILRPPRTHAGVTGNVEITVRNPTARDSPPVGVHDPFDHGRRWARFRLAPLPPGQAMKAAYELSGEERGVYDLGPLDVRLEDPFGLASRTVATAPVTTLVVYPSIEPLDPLPAGSDERRSRLHPLAAAAAVDGELYALREYHVGDDLRRVHWRSTAKRDEVMIRHDDVPLQDATTVVLDLRDEVHTAATLEKAVSAAASIVHAARRRRRPVRLITSDGSDSGLGAGQAHVEAILERLAGADVHRGSSPASLLASPAGIRGQAEMVIGVTTGAAPDPRLPGVGQPRPPTVLVLVDPPGAPADGRRPPPGARVVRVGSDQPLSPAWGEALGAGGRSVTPVR